MRRTARLLIVGRLDPRKGHETVLRALAILHRQGRRVSLAVIGEGPLRRSLERLGSGLPVRFHGEQSAQAVAHGYRESDLVLAPARHGESFGVVLLEAMAAGKPIVASDIDGYRDVLAPSGAGELVAPDDAQGWASAIDRLLARPQQREAMGAAGLAFVPRFSWEALAPEVERVYARALGARWAIAREPAAADPMIKPSQARFG